MRISHRKLMATALVGAVVVYVLLVQTKPWDSSLDAALLAGQEREVSMANSGTARHGLIIAGRPWTVHFEDSVHERSLHQMVEDDLRVECAWITTAEVINAIPVSFVVGGRVVRSVQALHSDDLSKLDSARVARPIRDGFGRIVEIDGVLSLVVPRPLIDYYAAASEVLQTHKAAVRDVPAFIEKFNTLTPSGARQIAKDLMLARSTHEPREDEYQKGAERLVERFSITGVPGPLHYLIDPATGALCVMVPAEQLRDDGRTVFYSLTLCHTDGRWRVVL